ncbi:MAG TPA: lanthionine synthetase C family protein [Thermoanaerobaculia bacterium]|nr:lanthionine synthetase C family protein [Thermoanaerobaculia bacterium]
MKNWKPVLTGELAAAASFAGREVSSRLSVPSRVEQAAAATRAQTAFPRSSHWAPYAVSQGYAGLALLWSYLDAIFPEEEWDLTAREHLALAVRDAEAHSHLPVGLFSGLSGMAFSAWQLSRDGTRYRRLLDALDGEIASQAVSLAGSLVGKNGVGVGDFDVISGLSGIGAYLLCRRHEPGVAAALSAVVQALVDLGGEEDGVPRWHTPARLLWDEEVQRLYPHGNLNCGLAHGIPGPLAFLSLACRAGVESPGLPESIARLADWLCQNRLDDSWGVNWPTAVPLVEMAGRLEATQAPATAEGTSRCAWCYGSPGIARALWLAGEALDRADYRDIAVSAMEAVFRRPVVERRIDSPTFCHGIAGLLQITLRFAHDTGHAVFQEQSRVLVRQILGSYRPESLLGFHNIETPESKTDQPGLLDGAPGVALVLLAATTGVEPGWDRLFLLS